MRLLLHPRALRPHACLAVNQHLVSPWIDKRSDEVLQHADEWAMHPRAHSMCSSKATPVRCSPLKAIEETLPLRKRSGRAAGAGHEHRFLQRFSPTVVILKTRVGAGRWGI